LDVKWTREWGDIYDKILDSIQHTDVADVADVVDVADIADVEDVEDVEEAEEAWPSGRV